MVMGSTLADINSAQVQMERTERELSSGKSIIEPSDNPQGTSQAIGLESALSGLEDYETSAHDGTAWLDAANGALTGIDEAVQRVRELVVQAGNGTNSQGNLESIASEVEQLTQTVKQDADTQYAGQYIFSGTLTGTAPYQQGANDSYAGNNGSIARTVGPSTNVAVTVSISSLLGEGKAANDGKLLDTLRTIASNLREGTPAAREALNSKDLGALETNMSTLDSLQATVGASTDQINAAVSRIEDLRETTTTQLSNIQDANIAQVSLEYSNEQAAYTAALRAGASIVQESLLEFLH
jgi:flagellar hook-associated protein 3 FlgL